MNDNNDIKASILAKVNHDMRERDKAVRSIWYAMEGKMLYEQDRLYRMGINVESKDLMRDLMTLMQESIESKTD
ncbi:MAG: hypothetical protein IJM66_10745 [Muribaculaceae bacterium]|nr:hypothetical protein [Muribaculaceae bacterium]